MIFKISIRSILRQKSRSLAILFTIAFGVCALMIYHGFNAGIMNQYRENTIRARYGHGQINTKGYLDKIWEKPSERWMEMDSEVFTYLNKEVEEKRLFAIFPRIAFFALLNNGERNVAGRGLGVRGISEAKFFTTMNIIEGKNLSSEEDGILLGKGLAESLNLKVGDRVTVLANTLSGPLNAIDVYVTGVFYTGMKGFDDSVFRIQLSQTQILLDTLKVETVAIGLNDLSDWNEFENKFSQKFSNLDAIPFNILDKVFYQNSVDFLDAQFGFIFLIIVVIVILGIFNTVTTIIMERKGEVGNLRANGDGPFEIKLLLLLESLTLGLVGAILGVLLAYIFNLTLLSQGIKMPPGPGITRQFITFVELQPSFIPVCLLIGVLASSLGSYMASTKILKMKITHLLKGNLS